MAFDKKVIFLEINLKNIKMNLFWEKNSGFR
jgi:hypothetical protein